MKVKADRNWEIVEEPGSGRQGCMPTMAIQRIKVSAVLTKTEET